MLLKFHGQLPNGELARVLGISESNAGTRLHRALTHLRECCDEAGRRGGRMRIVSTPPSGDARPDTPAQALERALHAHAGGADAESWRELRDDVRALAAPISPQLERRLRALAEEHAPAAPPLPATPAPGARRHRTTARPRAGGARRRPWRALADSPAAAGALAAALCALIAAVAIAAPFSATTHAPLRAPAQHGQLATSAPRSAPAVAAPAVPSVTPAVSAERVESAPSAPSSGRVQQLGASITLAAGPSAVQGWPTASAAWRAALVATSRARRCRCRAKARRSDAPAEHSQRAAELDAGGARAARAGSRESQSLQDITGTYEAAQRALADAVAARSALLRALARASTQGQIESLRRRLALAGGAIERARSNLRRSRARRHRRTSKWRSSATAAPLTKG